MKKPLKEVHLSPEEVAQMSHVDYDPRKNIPQKKIKLVNQKRKAAAETIKYNTQKNLEHKIGLAEGRIYKDHPLSELQKYAEKLNDWANQETSLQIQDFFNKERIYKNNFEIWRKKCPELAEAYYFAMQIVGRRRLYKSTNRDFNFGYLSREQYVYTPEYGEAEDRAANLKAKENEGVTYVLKEEKTPDTGIPKSK